MTICVLFILKLWNIAYRWSFLKVKIAITSVAGAQSKKCENYWKSLKLLNTNFIYIPMYYDNFGTSQYLPGGLRKSEHFYIIALI